MARPAKQRGAALAADASTSAEFSENKMPDLDLEAQAAQTASDEAAPVLATGIFRSATARSYYNPYSKQVFDRENVEAPICHWVKSQLDAGLLEQIA